MDVSEEELQPLYTWVDDIPLSRPKRNIARDFSDGVLVAEIVLHYFPKIVELHNYSSANSISQKMYNWNTLNAKVFRKLGFVVTKPECEAVANCVPGAVERVLKLVKVKIAKHKEKQQQKAMRLEMGQAVSPYSDGMSPAPEAIAAAPPPHETRNGGGGGGAGSGGAGGGMEQQQFAPPPPPSYQNVQPTPAAMPPPGGMAGGAGRPTPGSAITTMSQMQGEVSAELLADKEASIMELNETVDILETKVRKLEQLVRLKDAKIHTLIAKMQSAGLS